MRCMTDTLSSMIDTLCEARRSASLADASLFPQALQTEADAYAVQRGVADALALFATPEPRHWKSGGANREAVLTHAPLADAGVWSSPAQAGGWHFQHRAMESEIALRLSQDVTAQMAAALMRAAAGDHVEVHSAGTKPGTSVNAESEVSVLAVGASFAGEYPKAIDPDLLARVDRVVIIGAEAVLEPAALAAVGNRLERWETDEPSLRGIGPLTKGRWLTVRASCCGPALT